MSDTSIEDFAFAIGELNTRTGLTGPALEELVLQTLRLSKLADEDITTLIPTVTRLFGDWGIATEDQSATLDKLFAASQLTGIGIGRLSDLVTQFGAPLRQLGFGFEETLALFASFEKEGVNTEQVLAGLRAGLARTAQAGEEPAETLARVTEEIKNAATEGDALAISLDAFGSRAAADMSAAIREGRFELDELTEAISNPADSLADLEKETRSFSDRMGVLGQRFALILAPAGEAVLDFAENSFAPFVESVLSKTEQLGQVFRDEGFAGLWARFVEGIKIIAPIVILGLVDMLQALGDWVVRDAIPFLAEKGAELFLALLDWLGNTAAPFAVKKAGELLAAIGTWITDTAVPFLIREGAELGTAVLEWIGKAALKAPGLLADLIGAAVEWLTTEGVDLLLDTAEELGESALDWIRSAKDTAIAQLGELFGTIVTWLTDTAPGLIADAASGMWNGIANAFVSVINFLIRAWNGLELEIPGFDPPGPGPTFSGFTLGFPDIDELAGLEHGGTTRTAGSVLVGESGPEILDLPSGASVIPLDFDDFGGGSGTTIENLNVENPVDATADEVAESIDAFLGWSTDTGRDDR